VDIISIHKDQPGYPASLRKYLAEDAPAQITAIGNPEILHLFFDPGIKLMNNLLQQ